VKHAVRAGDYVSFRDRESLELVQGLGVTRPSHVFPDSVYALDLSEAAARSSTTVPFVVGLNPIGFADPRIWPRHDARAYGEYLDKLTAFALWLHRQHYIVKIFSAEQSVDIYAIEDMRRRLAESLPPAAVDEMVGSPAADVRTLIAEMSGFDFVVTSKFHGVVFSHLLQKPVVALSYHNKIDDLMRATGDTERCLQIGDFSVGDLKGLFSAAVAQAGDLRAKYRRFARERAAALASQFDDIFTPERLDRHSPVVRMSTVSGAPTMTSGRAQQY
jgi:polysaccharide pyruvyl transferase WcaK-like protein